MAIQYKFLDLILTIILYTKRYSITYCGRRARAPRFLTFSSISQSCACRSTNGYLRIALYTYLWYCVQEAHPPSRCAHGQYSIGDRRHDIRCATVGSYTYGGGGGGGDDDTITRFSVVRIVSLGRITRARYELYIIFLYYSRRTYIIISCIRNAKKIFVFTTQRGEEKKP